MRKTNLKNERGITLIALVITIIVLLILAGVAVSMLSGENSVINKVNSAKTENDIGAEEENVKLAVTTAIANNIKIENAKAIDDNLDDEWTVTGEDGGPYICKNKNTNNAYSVDINGTVTNLGKQSGNNEPSIAYNKKYTCIDGDSSVVGKYIIFSEGGNTEGTLMAGMTVTYEVKSHTAIIGGEEQSFKNAFFATINGVGPMFCGVFNDDYTQLRILEEPAGNGDGTYSDRWWTTVVEDNVQFEDFGSYNAVYENSNYQLVLYKNGMFTMGMKYYNNNGVTFGQYTGFYEYNKITKELKINGICDDIKMECTVSDDETTITATCQNSYFNGVYTKNSSTDIYKYNPVYNEKGIYTNAIYINKDKNDAISIGNKYICLVQTGKYGNLSDANYGIEISKFDQATNTTITVSNEGKTITYNGDEYNLVTLEDMNKASK